LKGGALKYSGMLAGLLLVALFAGRGWAHGSGHHHESAEGQEHMQQMQQLKEQIPEEYRVMNRTPVVPDTKSINHGAQLYGRFCAVCHGSDGDGDGQAAATMESAPANFHDLEHSATYGPGEKYWIIGNGSGATGMPGFANELSPQYRWDLVNYIHRLQQGQ